MAVTIAVAPAVSRQQDDESIKLRTELVTVDVTLTDKNGNFIRNLKAEDFAIYEDGEFRKLDFFEASEEAALTRPLAVVFALDRSGSIKTEEVSRQLEAAETFIKLVRPESLFAVIAFNTDVRVMQDFTSDPKKIGQAFRRIGKPEGLTRIFATIDRSISMLKRAPRFRGNRRLRRVVIVISDGYDSVDPVDQRDLIQRANDAEVTVYSITIPSYMAGTAGQRALTLLDVARIVPLTGGADFSADALDFTPVFKAIAEEIRSSYTLAFYPPEKNRRDGRTHKILIGINHPPPLIVRASRTSYQSPK